jgi:hypothetical protein
MHITEYIVYQLNKKLLMDYFIKCLRYSLVIDIKILFRVVLLPIPLIKSIFAFLNRISSSDLIKIPLNKSIFLSLNRISSAVLYLKRIFGYFVPAVLAQNTLNMYSKLIPILFPKSIFLSLNRISSSLFFKSPLLKALTDIQCPYLSNFVDVNYKPEKIDKYGCWPKLFPQYSY